MDRPVLKEIFWVAIGGSVGACMRYGTNLIVFSLFGDHLFITATYIENILGCFFIGSIFTFLGKRAVKYRNLNLFLLTGIIGSYTTYSGFMTDAFILQSESLFYLMFYVFTQLLSGLIAFVAGMKLVQMFMDSLRHS